MQFRAALRKHGPHWHGTDFKFDLDLEDGSQKDFALMGGDGHSGHLTGGGTVER